MFAKYKIFWVILGVILTGCRAASPAAATAAPPEIWQIQIPPSLAWMGPELNVCALKQPGVALLVETQPQTAGETGPAQIILRWGDPPAPDTNTWYQIDEDNLVIIVHPDNPLTEITPSQLRQIFTGQVRSWSDFSEFPESLAPIDLPEENEIRQALAVAIGENPSLPLNAMIAADAETMRQAVAAQFGAIGYIPSGWLDDTVRELPIKVTDQTFRASQPVLLRFVNSPTAAQKAWLNCLQ
jgi:phosphate transport system substrate-binding protein